MPQRHPAAQPFRCIDSIKTAISALGTHNMFNIHMGEGAYDKQYVKHACEGFLCSHTHLISSMIGLKRDAFITICSPKPNLDNPYENTPAFDIYSARQRCLGLSAVLPEDV